MEANDNSIQKVLLEFENHRDVENQDINFYSKADLIFFRVELLILFKSQTNSAPIFFLLGIILSIF